MLRILKAWLYSAGVYALLWSILLLLRPGMLQSVVLINEGTNALFWDLMAVFTFLIGLCAIFAARDILQRWQVLIPVFLFHGITILMYVVAEERGLLTEHYGRYLFTNHIIWLPAPLITFLLVYKRSFEADDALIDAFGNTQYPLELFDTTNGENLESLSNAGPVLLVFLRHFGCTFCKETLVHVQKHKKQMEESGIRIVLVHMVSAGAAKPHLEKYGLQDVLQISDPESIIYKQFKLRRGRFGQLFGWKVWMRWIELGLGKKIVNSKPAGDVYQMPGIFLLHKGKVVRQFVHRSISDVPDYRIFLSYRD
ncbi:MAG: SelL-related redox protein [Chitinophagales bacterium]